MKVAVRNETERIRDKNWKETMINVTKIYHDPRTFWSLFKILKENTTTDNQKAIGRRREGRSSRK